MAPPQSNLCNVEHCDWLIDIQLNRSVHLVESDDDSNYMSRNPRKVISIGMDVGSEGVK